MSATSSGSPQTWTGGAEAVGLAVAEGLTVADGEGVVAGDLAALAVAEADAAGADIVLSEAGAVGVAAGAGE